MSVSSIAAGSPNWYRSRHATSGDDTSPRRRHECCEPDTPPRDSEQAARRNPLVAAMMAALQGLFPAPAKPAQAPPEAAPSAVPAATATTPAAPASAASTPDVDLKEAARAFAYELFGALRGEGRGHGHGHDHGKGRKPEHGYGDHAPRRGNAYGDLAQRLTALAQSVEAASPAAPASTSSTPTPAAAPAPTAAPVPESPTSTGTIATPPGGAAAPATLPTVASASGGLSITININFGGPAPAAQDSEPQDPPLLSAFKKLLAALDPSATPDAAALPSPASRLAAFLRQMAQALTPETRQAAVAPPASGSLLDVTA